MAWVFLYAGIVQETSSRFSVAGLLNNTKTFHDLFAAFASPTIAPILTFLVSWGHLLIGISLLIGLLVRVSATFGLALMLLYWMAHMDWPYIEFRTNFIIDFHIVYAVVLAYLIAARAGRVVGLDNRASQIDFIRNNQALRRLIG